MNLTTLFLLFSAVTFQKTCAFFFQKRQLDRTDPIGVRNLDLQIRGPQGQELLTELDDLRGITRMLRAWTVAQYDEKKAFRENIRLGKIQREVPAETSFPCNLNFARSITPPPTVHQLRPGDIDIIAAIGDSMTAGTCLLTESYQQILYESRGLTFSGGCRGNWRRFLTLPNILKVFNPNLYGCALVDSYSFQRASRLNIAEPIGMSRDMLPQAKSLVQRMRKDPNVDFGDHWKLLTIFMGSVDYCADFCVYDDVAVPLRYHEQHLRQTLTFLRDNVPHLIVNLLPAPNMIRAFLNMKLSTPCYVIHHMFCFCITSLNLTVADLKAYEEKILLWQDLDAHIANLPEFNTDDFAVSYHPFLTDPKLPTLPNGETDQRYFATDCFHLSQLGHASLANSLWNSMMQPIGNKKDHVTRLFESFECPNSGRPYLATVKNSLNFGVQFV